ncbi:hypothetical protein RV03_GL002057 [Enterococcus gallinarum]|nr:hypothetical protein RV03_GL002057 [Enterococcus gallinarum]
MIILKLSKYVLAGLCGLSIATVGIQSKVAHADAVGAQSTETVSTPPVCQPITGSKLVKEVTYEDRADHFKFVEDQRGEGTKYSGYKLELNRDFKSNRLYVKLITDPGSSLGTIENSIEEYSRKNVGGGKVEYKFYFTLFNYKPTRTIHINVSPINE